MYDKNRELHLKLERVLVNKSIKDFRNKIVKEFDFAKQEINNIVFNTKSHQTAVFKEFLYTDDKSTEFIKRFYNSKESRLYIKKIVQFYIKFSIVYPIYYLLESSKFLYRNINEKEGFINKSQRSFFLGVNISVENILGDIKLFNKQKIRRSNIKIKSKIEKFKSKEAEETLVYRNNSKKIDDSINEVERIIYIISYVEGLKEKDPNNKKMSLSMSQIEQTVQSSEVKHNLSNDINLNKIKKLESEENKENKVYEEYLETRLSNERNFISEIKKNGEKIIQNLIEKRNNKIITSLQRKAPSLTKEYNIHSPLNIKTTCTLRKNNDPENSRSLKNNNIHKTSNMFLKVSNDLYKKKDTSNDMINTKYSLDKKNSLLNSVSVKRINFPNLILKKKNSVFPYSSQLKVKIVDSKSYTNLNSTSSNINNNHKEYGSQNVKKIPEFSMTNNRLKVYMKDEYKFLSPDHKKINSSNKSNLGKVNNLINFLQINSNNTRNYSKNSLSHSSTVFQNTLSTSYKKSIFSSRKDTQINVSKSIKLKK